MILLKYEKVGSAAYLPHLDVLRLFGRAVRRAGLKVRYSEGFHPHQKFKFCNPMSLGIESAAEYCAADCEQGAEEFRERFNAKSVPGLRILMAAEAKRDPNFAKILVASDYEIACEGIETWENQLAGLANSPSFVVKYEGKDVVKPAADKLLGLSCEKNLLRVRLKTGLENLKADAWAREIFAQLGIEAEFRVRRTAQYWEGPEGLTSADLLFAGTWEEEKERKANEKDSVH